MILHLAKVLRIPALARGLVGGLVGGLAPALARGLARGLTPALVAVCLLVLGGAGPAAAETVLHILHINDLHSRLQQTNSSGGLCKAEAADKGECFGGAARLMSAINQKRAALEGRNLILLDAGDQFQGSLLYTVYQGQAEAEMMEAIGFDAMAIGNHEFDDGPSVLAKFRERVSFPVVSGNLDLTLEPELLDQIADTTVLTVRGTRVGIVSAVARDTPETSSPGPNISFGDEVTALRADVKKLTRSGVKIIIALTHVGLHMDRRIAAEISDIDLIVGGHSHSLLSNKAENSVGPYPVLVTNPDGVRVPIVQAGSYGKYLGHLVAGFDDEGALIRAEGDVMLLDASIAPDPKIAARIAALAAAPEISAMMTAIVTRTGAMIDGARTHCRHRDCALGNLVTDAMLAHIRPHGGQIALFNSGGIRASLEAGDVTMADILTALPYGNTLATFELTGADVITMLENAVSAVEEESGRLAQISGARYVFDPEGKPGARIVSVTLVKENGDTTPLDPGATYHMATNEYMRRGGDGYEVLKMRARNAYDFGPPVTGLLADYLAERPSYSPYTDGRISRRQ